MSYARRRRNPASFRCFIALVALSGLYICQSQIRRAPRQLELSSPRTLMRMNSARFRRLSPPLSRPRGESGARMLSADNGRRRRVQVRAAAEGNLMTFKELNSTWIQTEKEVELVVELPMDVETNSVEITQVNRRILMLKIGDVEFKINDLWQNVVADSMFWSFEERAKPGGGDGVTQKPAANATADWSDIVTDSVLANALEDAEIAESFDLIDLRDANIASERMMRQEGGELADTFSAATTASSSSSSSSTRREDEDYERYQISVREMLEKKEELEAQKRIEEMKNQPKQRIIVVSMEKETPGLRWKALQTCADLPPSRNVTSKVYMDIAMKKGYTSTPLGRIVIGLFGDAVPKASENFRSLCTGEKGNEHNSGKALQYTGSRFFKIIPGVAIQGGDIENNDGTGGFSIYEGGGAFSDEAYDKHDEKYLVSYMNGGRSDDNKSQFFVLLRPDSWLNDKHVVVGTVLEGRDVVDSIETFGDKLGVPTADIVIKSCGEYFDDSSLSPSGGDSEPSFLRDFDVKVAGLRAHSILNDLRDHEEDDLNSSFGSGDDSSFMDKLMEELHQAREEELQEDEEDEYDGAFLERRAKLLEQQGEGEEQQQGPAERREDEEEKQGKEDKEVTLDDLFKGINARAVRKNDENKGTISRISLRGEPDNGQGTLSPPSSSQMKEPPTKQTPPGDEDQPIESVD